MCDCEELEYEDFQLMLDTISKKAVAAREEEPAPIPQLVVSKRRK